MNQKSLIPLIIIIYFKSYSKAADENEQCTKESCAEETETENLFKESASNIYYSIIDGAWKNYKPYDDSADCHLLYGDVIKKDLELYQKGITLEMLESINKYGTRYRVLNGKLYRDSECHFPTRCGGIEHFLLELLPKLDDTEFIINTRDWPQLPKSYGLKMGPIFSFSKTDEYFDIFYPAWTFWQGGSAISLYPTGIGRWDLLRDKIRNAGKETPWSKKKAVAFFRGSRTSDERDSLVLLSRRKPDLVDAKYTKNQAWKSPKDTLNEEPAKEVSFEDHCEYKYLFNFRGVAASFRFKHLFLCKSLVFHVGNEWQEFFYPAMKPWVHYVPLKSYPSEHEIEEILLFFKEHDDLSKRIAENGYKFIWKHLKMGHIFCYWESLLKQYQRLLKFTVKPDNNLIEIKKKVK